MTREQGSTSVERLLAGLALSAVLASLSTPVAAGPYAQQAARVQANGGLLQMIAMGGLETQAAATLDAAAINACHTMALEGVTVTSVRIVTQGGQVIRLVAASTLAGC